MSIKNGVILSYFNDKLGPVIFSSFPVQQHTLALKNIMNKFMDFFAKSGYLIYIKNDKKIFNTSFEIPSTLNRGKILMISISVIVSKSDNLDNVIIEKLKTFKAVLKVKKDIYFGFHDDGSEIFKEKNKLIKSYIKTLYREIFA